MEPVDILDRAHLGRYTLGDAALETEILGLFVQQVPETVAQLRRSDDVATWKRAAHTLKGSARAVGAWRLAHAAERAEQLSSQLDVWDELVDNIEAAILEVRDQIEVVQTPELTGSD